MNTLEKETIIYPMYYCEAKLESNIRNNDYLFVGERKITVRGLGKKFAFSEPYCIYFYAW